MRLLPISAGGARDVDDTVIIDGVQIPKGWFSIYSPALTHEQDPKTFLEDGSHMDIQDGFKPERWMDAGTRPTTEYIPYGAGHRYCLGHTLATAGRIFPTGTCNEVCFILSIENICFHANVDPRNTVLSFPVNRNENIFSCPGSKS
mmetsp:Transcript_20697/g.33829  ORF Transcript_20697/g.33829 Transcript_20697/m.33829 type:complete len:146 (+) Transcript_20697:226-663(+)